ncbi:23165_t:CDS:2, partial [Gigaspora margarita]
SLITSSNIRRTQSKVFFTTPTLSELLLTISATQPMDTTGTNITTNPMAQTIANIELDSLPEHTAKKVKASTSNDENALTSLELSPTNRAPTHINDERPEPPKNLNSDSHDTDLPDMKFSHDNPYLVIASKPDLHDNQCITMQQNDPTQNTQNINEQVKR